MSSKEEGDWRPCSEGTLSATIQRVRTKRMQAISLRVGSSSIVGIAILFLVFSIIPRKSVELACYQVGGLLPDYVAGTLDEGSRRNVEKHLDGCEKCRRKLYEMKELKKVAGIPYKAFLLQSPADKLAFSLFCCFAIPDRLRMPVSKHR